MNNVTSNVTRGEKKVSTIGVAGHLDDARPERINLGLDAARAKLP